MAGRPRNTTPTRSERLAVRVTPELREAIERAAAKDRRTVSDWISLALERAIADTSRHR